MAHLNKSPKSALSIELKDYIQTTEVVSSPEHAAGILQLASPKQAHNFALAMHEQACGSYDENRTVFWREVVEFLAWGSL